MDAEISAADLALGKTVQVAVRNPDGETSNALTFAINNPVPALASLSPSRADGGGPGFTLSLAGSNFVPGSVVRWKGNDRITTYVSGTELQTSIASGDISTAGEAQVMVLNSAPGGGASNAITFPVSGFTLGASPVSATVTAGQSATYTIQVTPQFGSFDSSISFTATGLPRGCTAAFAPASVTPGADSATTTLTLRTTSRAASTAGAGAMFGPAGPVPPAAALLLLVAACLLWVRFKRSLPIWLSSRRLAAAALICLIVLMVSCSAGGGGGSTPSTGTPAGSHNVTVQATSGNLTVSMLVTVVVH